MIDDRMPIFKISATQVLDDAVREGAKDVLLKAKTRAPLLKGSLRADTQVKRQSSIVYRISFNTEYARYQEFGGDGRRTVRNYTTSGTGKHYLRNSGDEVANQLDGLFKKHGARARA